MQKTKTKNKDKPDAKVTSYYCSKVDHRKAAQKEKQAATKDAAAKKGVKKAVAAVDVGSLEVGLLSAYASEFSILSVEVAEIDEAWRVNHLRCKAVAEGNRVLPRRVPHGTACGLGSRIRSFCAESGPRDEPHGAA